MQRVIARVSVCLAVSLARSMTAGAQQTAPSGTNVGTVTGVVLDKSSGDPIIEAGVEVVEHGRTVRTDLDGRYTLKLPPGTYQLRVFAPLYQGVRLQAVLVKTGEVTTSDARLAPAGTAGVEVVEVVAQARKAAEATQLLKRQKAAVVEDNVSAETIKKSTDSNAGEVVARVPGVTVKEERFIIIRGLNERYSGALLFGSRLPSPDPDRRVVPLDVFPAEFLDSVSVLKTYTPDLPGDFAGGVADIDLRDYPDALTVTAGWGGGINTSSTFKRFQTYEGGDLDYLGFGDGFRALPGSVGDSSIGTPSIPKQRAAADGFRDIWNVRQTKAAPNSGLNLSVGNSWGPFGLQVGGLYTTEYKQARNAIVRQFVNANTPDAPVIETSDDFVSWTSEFKTQLGGILNSAYKLGDDHKLTLRAFVDHESHDFTVTSDGTTNQLPDAAVANTRLQYTQQQLEFGQLGGQHRWPWVELDWRTAYSRVTKDIPDTRTYTYVNGLFDQSQPASGYRVFSDIKETLSDSSADFTVPFLTGLPFTDAWSGLPAKFKFGPAYACRDRDFHQRRFRYTQSGLDTSLPPDELFNPDNIGSGLMFQETTDPRDEFSASEEIAGGYGMFDLPLVQNRLRLITGVRVEYSFIGINTADDRGDPERVTKNNLDPLPSANLVYTPRSDMNVRAAYGQAVSRPEFRELSPTLLPPLRGETALVGNPELVEAHIRSYDLRWEWFYSPGELVSLGGFYKQLDQPIEQIVVPGASDRRDSFKNADSATLSGFEFEGRKNLGFVRPWLTNLTFTTNVAYIASNVIVPRASTLEVQTSTNRQLQGQSPFVVNAALDYTHPTWGSARLLYNTEGPSISSAGSDGLPDITFERRNQLDVAFVVPLKPVGLPFNLKFGVENILNAPYVYKQGNATNLRYTTGTKFSLGFSYTY